MPIRVCLAGATGWAGSELARAIARQPDLNLVAAISRTQSGRNLAEVLGDPEVDCPIYGSAQEALVAQCDVFVEYTKPDSAKHNVLAALDAPSGTARELAARLAKVRSPEPTVPVDQTIGSREARGATLAGSQVRSIRLPGFVISAEVIFGMPDQTLSIRHDSGSSARPYVDGALIAIRRVSTPVGLHRGLDSVLDL
jgi:dihydrodipicolinate reductase